MMKKVSLMAILCLAVAVTFCSCGESAAPEVSDDTSSAVVTEDDSTDVTEAADQDQSASIVGTWTLSAIVDASGESLTLEEYCAANGVDASGMEATYTFSEDGTLIAAIGGIGTPATYTFDGETVDFTVTANGAQSSMKYDATRDCLMASDANSGLTSIMTR